ADYARRWGVETLFGCLKTRGFCLEATHVTDKERLRKLIALMALCFCWAYRAGHWLIRIEPLKIKKHGRLAKSIFRHGFDHLRRIFCNQDCSVERLAFIRLCQLLSCTLRKELKRAARADSLGGRNTRKMFIDPLGSDSPINCP